MKHVAYRLRSHCLLACLLLMISPVTQAATLVVYGGTGNIGSRIVSEAVNRGHSVVVVSRSADQPTRERLRFVKGDILDSTGVRKQITGADVVVSVINSQQETFFMQAAQSMVSAVQSAGNSAPRLIWVGGASSLEVEPGKRLLDTMPAIAPGQGGSRVGHTNVLGYLRTLKDVKWTFVSPSMEIMPGTRTGKFRLGGDQLIKDAAGNSRISIEDFAVAIVDEIEKPQQIGKRFTVGY